MAATHIGHSLVEGSRGSACLRNYRTVNVREDIIEVSPSIAVITVRLATLTTNAILSTVICFTRPCFGLFYRFFQRIQPLFCELNVARLKSLVGMAENLTVLCLSFVSRIWAKEPSLPGTGFVLAPACWIG